MSLRAFHLLFIVVSIILAFGFAAWSVDAYLTRREGLSLVYAAGSAAVGVALVMYFLKVRAKFKRMEAS
ncbi:MAG: hypothetical protein AB1428_14135 [Bacteroidota bacterium]